MSYAGNRLINDADSHLMELPSFLVDAARTADASCLANLAGALGGQFDPGTLATGAGVDGHPAHTAERVDELIELGDDLTKGPKWHEALGAFNGRERKVALDMLGFQRQVIFSSFCARLIFAAPDNRGAYASAQAHNRAMAEFCRADPRLLGIAMVPLTDVALALDAIEQAIKLGLAGVWIGADAPGGRSPGHRDHNGIWARLAEAGLPFILHVGSAEIPIAPEWMNDGEPGNVSARGGAEVIGSKDLAVIHFPIQRFLSALVLDGVLERFPGLRGGVIELGAGWVPDMLRRLDHAVQIWSRSEPQLARMQRLPSQQMTQQIRFTPYPFEDVGQLVSESNAELYMFSSDYPHAEGGRDPIGRFTRSMATLSAQDQHKFFADNFNTLYPP